MNYLQWYFKQNSILSSCFESLKQLKVLPEGYNHVQLPFTSISEKEVRGVSVNRQRGVKSHLHWDIQVSSFRVISVSVL